MNQQAFVETHMRDALAFIGLLTACLFWMFLQNFAL